MKLAVVDDDEREIEEFVTRMQKRLGNTDDIEIYRFTSGKAFTDMWEKVGFNIVVLDIFLGDANGMEIAKAIRKTDKDVRIVFCSVSTEYACESYEVDASYYLHKPYSDEDIRLMLERMRLDECRRGLMKLPDGREIKLKNIIGIRQSAGTVVIKLKNGTDITVKAAFSEIKKQMADKPGFCAVNDGILVNLASVAAIRDNEAILTDKTSITLPKRRSAEITQAYISYCFERLRKGGDR